MGNRIDVDNRCTGCNACVSSCPVQAISLKNTCEGFWYPRISENLCIGCGRCLAICPVYSEKNTEGFFAPISYAGWNKNQDEHINSSSGGIFSVLARSILKQGGSIYGASYIENFTVGHIRIDKEDDLPKIRESKYVQGFISDEVLGQVKRDLRSGRLVLFSGAPCQAAAVNRMFPQYGNLLTIDVVFHGAPSPKAWESYLDELLTQKGEIVSVNISARTEDLLERLGLQDRYVTNSEVASVYMDINGYFDIEDKITMWEKEPIEFLKDSLDWRVGYNEKRGYIVFVTISSKNIIGCEVAA